MALGLVRLGEATKNQAYLDFGTRAVASHVNADGTIAGDKLDDYNIDNIPPGKVLLAALDRGVKNEAWTKAVQTLRAQMATHPRTSEGGFWHKNRYPHQMWLDGLYMASPFLAQYAGLFKEPALFDDVAKQIILMDRHGYDAATGLYWHAWDEAHAQSWADPKTGFSPNFWSRATPAGLAQFSSFLMLELGRWDAARGWTKQLHLGALRSNNTRLLKQLGPDPGFDSIGDFAQTRALARYLDALDSTGELPRTVLYNLNPADNYAFSTMIGNFPDGSVPGKMQFGSGWWFLDQKEAMEWQMNALSNNGLLSRFVGMLTDSRSFLSYTRHEYFRRVLCNLLGAEMERGELPADRTLVGSMVRNICFANARDYFRLVLDPAFR